MHNPLVEVEVEPDLEPSELPSGLWLSSKFGDTKVPFDDLADAVRMTQRCSQQLSYRWSRSGST